MKAKYKNTGTKEFPFYRITVDGEYYCATDDVLKAKNLVRILTIPVVVKQSEQLRCKCDNLEDNPLNPDTKRCLDCLNVITS